MTMTAGAVLEALDALEKTTGVRPGITGGWGIDALLRRETRPHGDVDLGIASESVSVAIDALARLGYAVELDQRPARIELAGPNGRVDLHPIACGCGWCRAARPASRARSSTTRRAASTRSAMIGRREVRCGTPELQLSFHSHYAPRDHDRRDMAALAEEFGLELPESYRSDVTWLRV